MVAYSQEREGGLSQLLHLLPNFRKEQKQPTTPLLASKAEQLWHLLAPDRRPGQEQAASFSFHYIPQERKPQTEEQSIFYQLMRPYWRDENDNFHVYLSVDPLAYDGSNEPRWLNLISFQLSIYNKPPFTQYRDPIPVLRIFETPPSRNDPYDVRIFGDGYQRYWGKTKFEVVGFDKEKELLVWTKAKEDIREKVIGSLLWRRGFAEAVLDQFHELETANKLNIDRRAEDERFVYVRSRLGFHHGTISDTMFPYPSELGPDRDRKRSEQEALFLSLALNPKSRLTFMEHRVLSILCENKGNPVPKDELERSFVGVKKDDVDRIIARLRIKLEVDSKRPKVLTSVRGRGYRLPPEYFQS